MADRNTRFFTDTQDSDDSTRTPSERDYDRVLHAPCLRRLAGVTQVADPAEGHVFHNRLTHTLRVAQIGRRLAEKLLRTDLAEVPEARRELPDPEVVATACLI